MDKRKSLILFISLLGCLILADRLVYSILHYIENDVKTGQSVGKANHFNGVKDSVELLILGSSRAARHVDPGMFEVPAFNMGMDGTHFGYAATLIASLKKRQTLLVHVDHNEIYDPNYTGEDMLALLNEAQDSEAMSDFIEDYFPSDILLSKISHCYVYNGKVLGMIKNYISNRNSSLSNGFTPLVPTDLQRATFQKILDDQGTFHNNNIFKPVQINQNFEDFVDFAIRKCKTNNCRMIFFTSPSLNTVDNDIRTKTANFFKSKGVLYVDHSEFFKNFNIENWKDRTHMSKIGAKIYTEKLIEEVQN